MGSAAEQYREDTSAIEISFAAPVHLGREHQRRLVDLIGEICDAYEAKHPDRVMWPFGIGQKMLCNPLMLSDDEPIPFDESVFSIECAERENYDYAPASVDTRPKDEDPAETGASLASGAVPAEEQADAQTPAISTVFPMSPDQEQLVELVERLTKRCPVYLNEPEPTFLINPDGPEAATTLTSLSEEIERLRKALQKAVDNSTGKPNVWFFEAKDALARSALKGEP